MSVTAGARSDPAEALLPATAGWGLAVLRVVTGVVWLHEAWWKLPPGFGILRRWVERPLEFPVFEPYNAIVEAVVLPNFTLFAWTVYVVEAALGGFLVVGLATRLWSLVGLAMSVPIFLSVANYSVTSADGVTLSEWRYAYYLLMAAHVALFATAAGRYVGVDGALRPQWRAAPGRLARTMARLS